MNNGQLKDKLIDWSHRRDLANTAQKFVNGATERINLRFGKTFSPMGDYTDSNAALATHGETLYFYAAMRELSVYIKDFDEAQQFDSLFETEASRMNIHNREDSWITDATELTHIRSEEESLAIVESANGS